MPISVQQSTKSKKHKATLFSSTLKVEEKRVLSDLHLRSTKADMAIFFQLGRLLVCAGSSELIMCQYLCNRVPNQKTKTKLFSPILKAGGKKGLSDLDFEANRCRYGQLFHLGRLLVLAGSSELTMCQYLCNRVPNQLVHMMHNSCSDYQIATKDQIKKLKTHCFLQLLKLKERKCFYFLDLGPLGLNMAIFSFSLFSSELMAT